MHVSGAGVRRPSGVLGTLLLSGEGCTAEWLAGKPDVGTWAAPNPKPYMSAQVDGSGRPAKGTGWQG